jgi:hypothetical protein
MFRWRGNNSCYSISCQFNAQTTIDCATRLIQMKGFGMKSIWSLCTQQHQCWSFSKCSLLEMPPRKRSCISRLWAVPLPSVALATDPRMRKSIVTRIPPEHNLPWNDLAFIPSCDGHYLKCWLRLEVCYDECDVPEVYGFTHYKGPRIAYARNYIIANGEVVK